MKSATMTREQYDVVRKDNVVQTSRNKGFVKTKEFSPSGFRITRYRPAKRVVAIKSNGEIRTAKLCPVIRIGQLI